MSALAPSGQQLFLQSNAAVFDWSTVVDPDASVADMPGEDDYITHMLNMLYMTACRLLFDISLIRID